MSTHPEELRVAANGLTFAALTWGVRDAPLALCLHGYPDTPWTWRHLGPHLADRGWRVVAPFLRGYAPTDLAPDDEYSAGALGRDALALRDALGSDDRAVLIGHDWGAFAAYNVTARAPHNFRNVVTLAVPPITRIGNLLRDPRVRRELGRQLRMSWYIAFNQIPGLAQRWQHRLIPKLWADWSPGFDAGEDLAHVFEALGDPRRRRAAVRYYRCLATQRGAADAFRVRMRQPVLALHGERDGCLSPALSRNMLDAAVPGTRAEYIDGAGHFLQLERPDVVNRLIAEWIAQ